MFEQSTGLQRNHPFGEAPGSAIVWEGRDGADSDLTNTFFAFLRIQ